MRFNITRSSIEALEKRGEVTIFDALNVFYDLCEDVKAEMGTPVFRLPVGNEDESVGRLNWAGRTIMRIADKNPEILAQCDKAQKYQKIEEELQEHIAALSKKEQELQEIFLLKEEAQKKEQELAERCKELQLQSSQLEKKQEENRALENRCRRLEEDIADCENTDLPKLQLRKSALEERLTSLQAKITEAQNENISLEEKVAEQAKILQTEKGSSDSMRNLLEERERLLREEIATNDSEIALLQIKIDEEEATARAQQEMKAAKELEWEKAKQERDKEELWFSSLEAKEKEKKLKELLQRVNVLKKAKEELLKELPNMCVMMNGEEADLVNDFTAGYHKTLDEIEKKLALYQKNHNRIVKIAEQ